MAESVHLNQLVGVWRRESIAVSDDEAFEDSVVYWLHAGSYFADMRWPLEPSRHADVPVIAFAGAAQWSTPYMRFRHEIDFTKAHLDDVARLTIVNGKVIERGCVTVADETIEFEEVWKPCGLRGESTRLSVARMETNDARDCDAGVGYFVRVDNFAIAMQDVGTEFGAACWRQMEGSAEWSLLKRIGRAEELQLLLDAFITGSPRPQWQVLLQGSFRNEL
jgi:hypothetical protein